ncbi:MAG: FAD-dependent oxidoreductase [Eubacteriales bacterium]|jgi:hypothetical protein
MTVYEPSRELPVSGDYDVVVAGGSCTGLFAAIRAARLGYRTLIVERYNCLGGAATLALVNVWHSLYSTDGREQIIAGLTSETLERLMRTGDAEQPNGKTRHYILDTEALKLTLDQLAGENSVTTLFDTRACAVLTDGGRVTHLVIENKSGRSAVRAGVLIDATGDADLAHFLGLPEYTRAYLQPPSACFRLRGDLAGVDLNRLIAEHGDEVGLPQDWGWYGAIPGYTDITFHADTHLRGTDATSGRSLSDAETEGRRHMDAILTLLKKYAPGDWRLMQACAAVGIRESRHIRARHTVTQDELLSGIVPPDAVVRGTYPVDVHHDHDAGITFRYLDGTQNVVADRAHPGVVSRWRESTDSPTSYAAPLGAIVQETYGNFICAGRMLDADEGAYGALRVMVNLNQYGEAAGVAAALALSEGCAIGQVSAERVRGSLKNGGSAL